MEAISGPVRRAGDVLDGRYRLVAPLGRGGFGEVWRAEELLPDGSSFREIALKLLDTQLGDASWVEEAKNLASLRHPSLVTIFGAGIFDEQPKRPYVVTELLLGETLAEVLRRRRTIPWRRVMSWALDIAAALDFIHERGVVHLDLKPGNLFWTDDQTLKVLDFGISQRAGTAPPSIRAPRSGEQIALDATVMAEAYDAYAATCRAEGKTTQRAIAGTPGFVAPEVLDNREATAASDAYALGVCMVQLATGRLPYAVDEQPTTWTDPAKVSAWWLELRRATLVGELRDLRTDPASLPPGIVDLAHRLLAADPVARGVRAGRLRPIVEEAWHRPYGRPNRPYVGLGAYGPSDEGTLFGRSDDVDRLGRELVFESAVFLEAPSGAGKTSLLAAALVPYLARHHVDDKDDWRLALVALEPDGDAGEALDRALESVGPGLSGASFDELVAHVRESPIGFVLAIDPLDPLPKLTPERRDRFVRWLADAASRPPSPGLRLAAALSDDATESIVAIESLALLRPLLRYVRSPGSSAARELVRDRAELARAKVTDPELVEGELERELMRPDARLCTIAIALEDLEAGWSPGAPLSGADFRDRGGLAGALARHADRVLGAMSPDERLIAEELLVRLSTTDGRPLPVDAGALVSATEEPERARSVVDDLVKGEVVCRRGADLMIAHPSLVQGWDRLVSVRLASMHRLAFLERLREATDAWDKSGGHVELLWSDGALREVREHQRWIELGIRPREREFIDESRRRARRGGLVKAMAALVLVLLVGGLLVGQRMVEERRRVAEENERKAVQRAYLSQVIARSRRTEDHYQRAAWILEALQKEEATDRNAALPLDLLQTAVNLPAAHVITLEPLADAAFPWKERWLVGTGPGGTLSVVDFKPPEVDVIEDADLDADLETLENRRRPPRLTTFSPHAQPLAQWASFEFDTSIVTRSVAGEVRVWRLRKDGGILLASELGERCSGPVHVARRAPVVACPTSRGVMRWDLRRDGLDYSRRPGRILDLSDDGSLVVMGVGRRVALWAPERDLWARYVSPTTVTLARVSPRDPVVALVSPGRIEVIDVSTAPAKLHETEGPPTPADARWDAGGLDLAVCDATRGGAHYYLRPGGRAPADPPPATRARPCEPVPAEGAPTPLDGLSAFGPLADLDAGDHLVRGGWQLPDGRWLTRSMLLFTEAKPAAATLSFRGRDGAGALEVPAPGESMSAAVPARGETAAVQIGDEVRLYDRKSGERLQTRKGNLLGACADERLLLWRADGDVYRILTLGTGHEVAVVPRRPGFVLGTDHACRVLLRQRLDGVIESVGLEGGVTTELAAADGYVFATRTVGGPERGGYRTLLAASSGALAEIAWPEGDVRMLGYALPRVTAMGEGPAGEILYADATGVVAVSRGGATTQLLPASGRAPWTDLTVAGDGRSLLLVSVDEIGILDPDRKELVGKYPLAGFERFSGWDAAGSVLLWSFDRVGGGAGMVIPNGRDLAIEIAGSLSNLSVEGGELRARR